LGSREDYSHSVPAVPLKTTLLGYGDILLVEMQVLEGHVLFAY
jgi:hypothetical protein